jgi:hypothetical protein
MENIMRDSDVQRMIENLEKALRNDPVKHCEVYKEIGCAHVDGYLCDMATCGIRENFLLEKNSGMLGSPRK